MMRRHHGQRKRIGVPKGMLRYLSLRILSQEPMSGIELIDQMNEYTDWRPSPGSMYPLLASLQEENLIKPYENGDTSMKRFTLTEEGARIVAEHRVHDQDMRNRNKSLRKMYWRLHRGMTTELYTSFANLLDVFEDVFTRTAEDRDAQPRLIKALDEAAERINEIPGEMATQG